MLFTRKKEIELEKRLARLERKVYDLEQNEYVHFMKNKKGTYTRCYLGTSRWNDCVQLRLADFLSMILDHLNVEVVKQPETTSLKAKETRWGRKNADR